MKLRFLEDHALGPDEKISGGTVCEVKNKEAVRMLIDEEIVNRSNGGEKQK